jgi:hypothetical protein
LVGAVAACFVLLLPITPQPALAGLCAAHEPRLLLASRQRAQQTPRMNYVPKPFAVAGVTLLPELLILTERLAENAHDLWAAQRIQDGWTYGPQRDDKAKKHPCLVAYTDLPDSEKEYDRQAALGTLKAILALGYHIIPRQS